MDKEQPEPPVYIRHPELMDVFKEEADPFKFTQFPVEHGTDEEPPASK